MGLLFNGSDQWLSVGNPATLRLSGAFTICCWALVTTQTASTYPKVFSHTDASTNDGTYEALAMHSGVGFASHLQIREGSTWYTVQGTAPTVNVWRHVAWEYDPAWDEAERLRIFENGAQAGANTGPASLTSLSCNNDIARKADTSQEYFYGTMFDLRIYSRAVSAAELAAIVTGQGCDLVMSGLLARWKMDEKQAGETAGVSGVLDCSGNASHASGNNLVPYAAAPMRRARIYG